MKDIPDELASRLKSCRMNITCLSFRKWDKDRSSLLKDELHELHEQLVLLLEPDEEFPPELLNKMIEYSDLIENYMKRFEPKIQVNDVVVRNVNNSDGNGGDDGDVVNELASLSLSNKTKIRLEQLPTFDGKFVNWKPYKSMIVNLLISNMTIDEVMKKSLLLKTLSNEPARIVGILIGELKGLSEIWVKLCEKYDDHELAILEIKNDLNKIPRIVNENQTDNLKMAKDIVENANLAVKFLETDSSFYVTNLIQAVAYKFYYRAQRKMLSEMSNFEDVVKYIDKLYKSALKYDYNKIEKFDQSTRNKEETKKAFVAAISSKYCFICGSNHQKTYECFGKFDSKTIAEMIKGKGLCLICLHRGHLSRNCSSIIDKKCEKCDKFHATEMHDVLNEIYQTKPKGIAASIPSSSESSSSSGSSNGESSDSGSVAAISYRSLSNEFDAIRNGNLENRPMIYGKCNGKESVILLDSGSNISLIDPDLLLDDQNISDKNYSMLASSPLGEDKTSHKKVVLKIRGNSYEISIDLFAMKMNEKNLIIIGTDNLGFFYKNQPKVLSIPTIFGDISYQARKDFAACSSTEMNNPAARENVFDIVEFKDEQSSMPKEELLKPESGNVLNIDNDNLNIDRDEDDDIRIKLRIGQVIGRFEAQLSILSVQRPKDNFEKVSVAESRLLAPYELGNVLNQMHFVFSSRITMCFDSMFNVQRFGSSTSIKNLELADRVVDLQKLISIARLFIFVDKKKMIFSDNENSSKLDNRKFEWIFFPLGAFEIANGRQQQPMTDDVAVLETNGIWPNRLKEFRSKFKKFWHPHCLAFLKQINEPNFTDNKTGIHGSVSSDRFIRRNLWLFALTDDEFKFPFRAGSVVNTTFE
uniref:Uncharacterized protein LOC113797415 n=1 Tax=Dermatophagoides pteronyssinus TaxID=6956 RepID=A0A6P6YEB3_DERPT|nr:uncharacterized protein LOC113797415 [Dermatophagoides pteronyssinus]